MKENSKIIAINRKAFHDYEIIQKYEAGIELHGSEVKSIREGKINLKDSYAILKKNQIFIIGMHIGQYSHTGFLGHDPYRNRKLLLHKKEILKIFNQVKSKGKTLIPLKLYFSNKYIKLEIAISRSKKNYEKKRVVSERDHLRDLNRELKNKKTIK